MRKILAYIALVATLSLTPALAQAACIAEYKAKRDNPLELYFDTAQISGPCTMANARAQLQTMLAARGQTLLKVVSVREN